MSADTSKVVVGLLSEEMRKAGPLPWQHQPQHLCAPEAVLALGFSALPSPGSADKAVCRPGTGAVSWTRLKIIRGKKNILLSYCSIGVCMQIAFHPDRCPDPVLSMVPRQGCGDSSKSEHSNQSKRPREEMTEVSPEIF